MWPAQDFSLQNDVHRQSQMVYNTYTRLNEAVPALTLPTEIACIIFKMAGHPPPPFDNPDTSRTDARCIRMEINVSHVCRLWRSMALTYPELWSAFSHDDLWGQHIPLDCLSAYLQRSGTGPVDFYFRLGNHKREDWLATVDLLVAHVLRWRRLSLRIDRAWPVDFLTAQIEFLSAPNLEMLELCTPRFSRDSLPMGARTKLRPCFQRGAPKLTSMRLDSSSFEICKPVDWHALAVVTVQIESNTNQYNLAPWATFTSLLYSPNLVNLSLVGEIFDHPLQSEMTKCIIATSLMNFRCSDQTVLLHLLRLLRAPRLQHLVINKYHLDDISVPLHFDEVAPKIFPLLSTLVLFNCTQTGFHLSTLAQATHYVDRLFLIHCSINTMDNLISGTEGKMLWPRLETITFIRPNSRKGTTNQNPSKYLGMLEQRSSALNNKKCKLGLHLTEVNRWKAKHRKSWAKLNEKGLYLGAFTEDSNELMSWPACNEAHFDVSSETHFAVLNSLLHPGHEY